jgi:hypothetical protein
VRISSLNSSGTSQAAKWPGAELLVTISGRQNKSVIWDPANVIEGNVENSLRVMPLS